MHITGTVLTIERSAGTFRPETAKPTDPDVAYDNLLINLLVDNTIVELKVPKAQQGLVSDWAQGEVVEFEAKAPKGTRFSIVVPALAGV